MITAGLTGGIASGKSVAAQLFHDFGARVIDADLLARQVVAPGREGLARIKAAFGQDVLTSGGELDRERLGGLVFADPRQRALLNDLLHPLIFQELHAQLERLQAAGCDAPVIADVPLLIECGMQPQFDRIIVVCCDPATQMRRLMARSGLDTVAAEERLASQMPLAEKRQYADYVIENQGTLQMLQERVSEVYQQLCGASGAIKK